MNIIFRSPLKPIIKIGPYKMDAEGKLDMFLERDVHTTFLCGFAIFLILGGKGFHDLFLGVPNI